MQLAPCSEQGLTKPGSVSDMGGAVTGPTVGKATCLWEQEHKTILDTMRTGAQNSGHLGCSLVSATRISFLALLEAFTRRYPPMPSPPPWGDPAPQTAFPAGNYNPIPSTMKRLKGQREGWGKWLTNVPSVPQELVGKLLHLHFTDKKTKGV